VPRCRRSTSLLPTDRLAAKAIANSDQHGYASTTDLIAAFPDRQVRLVDFKPTGDIYRQVGLQLEAYRQADFIVPHVGEPRRIPLPPVAETAAVLLRPDGTYEYRNMLGDLDLFLSLLRVWQWMRGNGKEAILSTDKRITFPMRHSEGQVSEVPSLLTTSLAHLWN
jgi:hypothetical protein